MARSPDVERPQTESLNYRPHIAKIAANDAKVVIEKDKQYGASWCKRGGTGAYHVFIRKFDRLEEWVKKFNYDIFLAMREDNRPEGLIDDIRDIRGYLLLIEAYAIENGIVGARYPNKAVEESERCPVFFDGVPSMRCMFIEGHSGGHSAFIMNHDEIVGTQEWDDQGNSKKSYP